MTPKEKAIILKRLNKAELLIAKGESDIGALAEFIQPLFDQEISVTPSTDGATITDENGELGFFIEFLNSL